MTESIDPKITVDLTWHRTSDSFEPMTKFMHFRTDRGIKLTICFRDPGNYTDPVEVGMALVHKDDNGSKVDGRMKAEMRPHLSPEGPGKHTFKDMPQFLDFVDVLREFELMGGPLGTKNANRRAYQAYRRAFFEPASVLG